VEVVSMGQKSRIHVGMWWQLKRYCSEIPKGIKFSRKAECKLCGKEMWKHGRVKKLKDEYICPGQIVEYDSIRQKVMFYDSKKYAIVNGGIVER
jgi:uncharacterized protein (DUF1330 family)